MIRFKSFILAEEENFDVDKFYADCEPFIKELRGISEKHLPMHGTRTAPDEWQIRKVTARETPRDTDIRIHSAANNYFEKHFNWPARTHSIFTTGDYEQATTYGPVCLCFPIGSNFQTLWSDQVRDFLDVYDDAKTSIRQKMLMDKPRASKQLNQMEYDEMIAAAIEQSIEAIQETHWLHNEELKEGYESGHEVLVKADKVYLIRMWTDEHQDVINHLKALEMIK
jgi:hypothetical protein